jgi:hypothetical protein
MPQEPSRSTVDEARLPRLPGRERADKDERPKDLVVANRKRNGSVPAHAAGYGVDGTDAVPAHQKEHVFTEDQVDEVRRDQSLPDAGRRAAHGETIENAARTDTQYLSGLILSTRCPDPRLLSLETPLMPEGKAEFRASGQTIAGAARILHGSGAYRGPRRRENRSVAEKELLNGLAAVPPSLLKDLPRYAVQPNKPRCRGEVDRRFPDARTPPDSL